MNPFRRSAPLALLACLFSAPFSLAQTEVLLQADADNTLYEDTTGDLSNGAGTGFFCGRPFGGAIQRGALHFDVAGALPAGVTIVSAQLELYMDRSIVGPTNVDLQRFSDSWGEGSSVAGSGGGGGGQAVTGDLTWYHRFYPRTLWTNPGGDFHATVSATTSVGSAGPYAWTSATLAADVQNMLDQPSSNYGWIVRGDESTLGTSKRFVTREGATASERPVLRIRYAPAATVSTQGNGCGSGPLQLGANGLPTLGNGSFALDISGGLSGAPVAVYAALSFLPGGFPLSASCALELDPFTLFPLLNASLSGSGALPIPIPIANDPALSGAGISLQAFALELSFESGIVVSNGLRVVPGA